MNIRNRNRNSKDKHMIYGLLMILLGVAILSVGVFDLLNHDRIIGSILYVFGVGFGRVLLSGCGVLMIFMAQYYIRNYKK